MAAHRYWRMLFSSNGSGAYASMSELGGFLSIDGSGVNQFTGGIAATSSSYSVGSNPVSGCFDSNINTWWATSGGVNGEWISYDLGAGVTKDITSIRMTARNDSYSNQAPNAGSWQWSDDNTTWTTAFMFTGTTNATQAQVQTFTLSLLNYRFTDVAAEVLIQPLVNAQFNNVGVEVLRPLGAALTNIRRRIPTMC